MNKIQLDAMKKNRNQLKTKMPNYFPLLNGKITLKQGFLFHQYLTEESFSDNIAALHNYKTVFYLPWLKFLDGVEKNRVRSVIETVLERVELSADELFDLNFVLNDFENSEFDKFVDYYKFYESKELQHQLPTDKKTSASQVEYHFWLLLAKGYKSLKGATYISNINSKDGWSILLPSLYDKSKPPKMNFPMLYVILANLYCKIDDIFAKYSRRYRNAIDFNYENKASEHYYNPLYETMQEYFEKLWEELMVDFPVAWSDMQYIGSTRATAQRLYSFDNVELDLTRNIQIYIHLKNIFSEKFSLKSPNLTKYVSYFQKRFETGLDNNETGTDEMFDIIDSFMSRWLKKLDLCDSFSVDTVSANGVSVGYSISFTKNGKTRSIADEGYGCIQLFSVLLAVQNALYQSAIDVMNESKDMIEYLIAIEEPENHLHPKLQSLLADMFLEAYQMMDLHFIIETHSEYMIRKSQLIVAENYNTEESLRNNPFKVYYIPSDDKPYDLQYTPSGRFANKFGEGFFDEAAMLDMAIIQKEYELKKKQILNN